MLVADRNINPRDVIVISVYPGTEGLIKQIKESGLEKAEHLVPEILEGLNYIESVSESLFLSVLLQNLDNDRSLQLLELL